MKQLLFLLAAVAWLFAPASAQTKHGNAHDDSADEKEILRLEDVLVRAWLKNDTKTISSIVADDFQYWSFKGLRRGKSNLLRNVARSEEGETKVEDPEVRVYGDAAVFTARITDSGKHANGEAFTTKTCITTVFVRRDGRWQMVADHETLIP
ncbi:MAG: nuclear transport factor 2 family protein [Acidobacteriota bacterium]|nr:nuclear transport factor 2 family protein [Acidobacteriota bacterium]